MAALSCSVPYLTSLLKTIQSVHVCIDFYHGLCPVPSPDVERLQSANCLQLWLDRSFSLSIVTYIWRRPTS